MKISVILWDAGFREQFHAIECLKNQDLYFTDYEVLWIEYFDRIPPEVLRYQVGGQRKYKFRVASLDRPAPWHIGELVNEGVRRISHRLILILDADVLCKPDFLSGLVKLHSKDPNLVSHTRRYNQSPGPLPDPLTWETVSPLCGLNNLLNYGAAVCMTKDVFESVNGYTEDPIFREDSAVAWECHIRLMNGGYNHVWTPFKLLHPYHERTGATAPPERLGAQMERIKYLVETREFKAGKGFVK
jgi:hypothetical protein